MTRDFIPRQEGDLGPWASNYDSKIGNFAAALGLDNAEVAAHKAAIEDILSGLNKKADAKATYKSAMAAGSRLVNSGVKSIRVKIKAIKTVKGYTEAIGEALGIIGIDTDVDLDNYKPEVAAKPTLGHVRIDFTKKGVEGVHVYGRKQGEPTWHLLGADFHSPYLDTKPLTTPGIPETREYMCRGLLNDEEVGVNSDIVSAAYTGAIE